MRLTPEREAGKIRRLIIGATFGLMLLAVCGYMIAAYYASLRLALRTELSGMHVVATFLIDEIEAQRLDARSASGLEKALARLDSAALLFTVDGRAERIYAAASKMIKPEQRGELNRYLSSLLLPFARSQLGIAASDRDTHRLRYLISEAEIDIYQLTLETGRYGIMLQMLGDLGLVTVIPLASYSLARDELLMVLVISSVLVLLAGLLGIIYLANFTARRIASSGRSALVAAFTDRATGLSTMEGLIDANLENVDLDRLLHGSFRVQMVYVRHYNAVLIGFGRSVGDRYMRAVAEKLARKLSAGSLLVKSDDSAFIIISDEEAKRADTRILEQHARGVVQFDNLTMPIEGTLVTIDRSDADAELNDLVQTCYTVLTDALQRQLTVLAYQPGVLRQNSRDLQYAAQLAGGLERGEFELYLQPKVDLKRPDHPVVGAEALIRWNHPEDGLLSPAHFIHLLSSSNLRRDFTRFVIRRSAECARYLIDQGYPVRISFNLSSYDTQDLHILRELSRALQQLSLPEGVMEIELLESQTNIELDSIARALTQIRSYGYQIAIDDFGTGMSSLNYALYLPVDILKVDSLFIRDADRCNNRRTMLSGISALAKSFDWKVVIEGVETTAEAELASALGLDEAQGYLFARPMPLDQFTRLLRKQQGCQNLPGSSGG